METDLSEKEEARRPEFFINQKVDAFIHGYEPCAKEEDADEVFNEIRLRQYFQAYSRPTGDPLVEYLDALSHAGFRMRTNIMGDPAIFVKWKC